MMQAQVARLPSARSNIPSRPVPSRREGFDEVPILPPAQDSNSLDDHPAKAADRNPQSVGYLSRLRRVTSRIPRPGQSMDENDKSEAPNAGDVKNGGHRLSHGYLEQLSPKGMDPGRFASICEKFEAMQLDGSVGPETDAKEEGALRKCRSSMGRRGQGGGRGGGRGRGRGGSRGPLRSQSARYAMLDSVGSFTGVSSPSKGVCRKPTGRDGESRYGAVAEAGVFGNMYVLNADDSDGGLDEDVGSEVLSGEERGWSSEMQEGRGFGSGGLRSCSELDNTDDSDGGMGAVRYNDDSARYPRPLADRQWKERVEREAAAVTVTATAREDPDPEACTREVHVTSPVTPVLEDRLVSVEEVDGENSCRDASLECEDACENGSIMGVPSDSHASDSNQAADSSESHPKGDALGGGRDQDRGYQNSEGLWHNEKAMMELGEEEEEERGSEQQGDHLRSSISSTVAAVDELREQLTAGAGMAYRSNPEPRILEGRSEKSDEEEEGGREGEAIPGVRRSNSKGQQNGSFDSMWSVDFPDPENPAGIISPASDFVEVFNSYGYSEDMPSSLFTRDAMDSVGIDKAWDHLFPRQSTRPPTTEPVEEASSDNRSRSAESRDDTYLELECCLGHEISERFPQGLSHQMLYLGSAPEFTCLDDVALESAMGSMSQAKAWTTECDRTVFDQGEAFVHEEECQASCSTPDSESTYCSAVSTSSRENEKRFGDPLPFLDPVFQSMRSEYANGQNSAGRCSYSWSGDPWKNLRLACAAEKIPHSARDTFNRPPLRFDVCLRSAEPSPKSRESSKSSSMADDIEFPPTPADIDYHSSSESVNGAAQDVFDDAAPHIEEPDIFEMEDVVVEEEEEVVFGEEGPCRTESVVTCSVLEDASMDAPVRRRKFKFYTKMVAMMKSVVPKRSSKVNRGVSRASSSRQDVTSPQLLNGCMPKLLHWKGSHEQPHHQTSKSKKKKHSKNKAASKAASSKARPRVTRSLSERSISDEEGSGNGGVGDSSHGKRRLSSSIRSSTKGSVRGSGSSSHKYSRRHMFIMDKIENERLGMQSQHRSRRGVVRESIDMLWLRHLSKTS
ncbi:hypothetical protein BSKO_14125 [Bryopsis sp. KO-2023]|nr:hypothetical protein BSKO_14125 [Bryopsis sp. KO-2023]